MVRKDDKNDIEKVNDARSSEELNRALDRVDEQLADQPVPQDMVPEADADTVTVTTTKNDREVAKVNKTRDTASDVLEGDHDGEHGETLPQEVEAASADMDSDPLLRAERSKQTGLKFF
jgi:hypothetical protein